MEEERRSRNGEGQVPLAGAWGLKDSVDGAQGSGSLYCSFAPLTSCLNVSNHFLLFMNPHTHLLF